MMDLMMKVFPKKMALPTARAIVELHGGRIGVSSQTGHGSVFDFSLPVS
jgi:signal transduction histidine kinase